MNGCTQHFPVAIESETIVMPPTGRFKALKEGVVHDIHASRITKVTKLKCFSCGEVIELNQDRTDKESSLV